MEREEDKNREGKGVQLIETEDDQYSKADLDYHFK